MIHDSNTNFGYSVPQARSGVSGVHAKSTRLTATVQSAQSNYVMQATKGIPTISC